jgi:hypothetical protein
MSRVFELIGYDKCDLILFAVVLHEPAGRDVEGQRPRDDHMPGASRHEHPDQLPDRPWPTTACTLSHASPEIPNERILPRDLLFLDRLRILDNLTSHWGNWLNGLKFTNTNRHWP